MKIIPDNILQKVIQPRPDNSHKGTFGKVLVVAGNLNMTGAAIMAGSAAVYAGAGLVTIASAKDNATAIHSQIPEVMFVDYESFTLKKMISTVDAVVVGPGLGENITAFNVIKTVFQSITAKQYLIIDGSAISLIARNQFLQKLIPLAPKIIYTPHQMEWERLSGIKIASQNDIQNRMQVQKLNATVILKKHHSEIYFPTSKDIWQLPLGGPEMATGGMGDTLTGILAAFLVQFNAPFEEKVQAAVYLHSKIATELGKTSYVVLPEYLIHELPFFMKKASLK